MKMPQLKEKDTICIVAPAGALKEADIAHTVQKLKNRGFHIELGAHIFNQYFYGYNYAGTVAERVEDLQWALNHPKAKAIWFARGGYGGVQLIDALDWKYFAKHPKWLIGYSDNTVFHQYLSLQKIPSIHGMTAKLLSKDQSEASFETVIQVIQNQSLTYQFSRQSHNQKGKVKGILTGGNLSILYSLLGSKTIDHPKGKILFIEDWQENWYHLDRMLHGLKREGWLDKIIGLIVGSFTKMDVKEENPNYTQYFDSYSYQIISDFFKEYDIPKAFGLPVGHINDNRALIMGSEMHMEVNEEEVILTFS